MKKPNKREPGAPAPKARTKWRKIALFTFIAVPWVVLFALFLRSPVSFGFSTANEQIRHESKPGPWGRLQAVHFDLKAPEKVTLDLCRTNLPAWFFGATSSKDQLSAFFSEAGCTPEQIAELLSTARPQTNGWVVNPTLELRLALSKAARAKIYFHLADFPENFDQHYAVRWPKSEFRQWLEGAELSADTKKWFEHLCYSDEGHYYFASESTVTRLAPDDAEKIRVCEALLRTKSMLVTLRVEPGTDVDALVRYWGAGGREREVRPILEGIARLPQGGEVDIVNLLPPTAETLLYTYPRLDEPYTDCHWAAFNFFNPSPKKKPLGVKETGEMYANLFTPISGQLQLGDLVCFNNAAGMVQHSAVYIADDIIFTKNGYSPKKPWVLMRLSDVQNIFWKHSRISYARRKHPLNPGAFINTAASAR
jgi:hypothetical protein